MPPSPRVSNRVCSDAFGQVTASKLIGVCASTACRHELTALETGLVDLPVAERLDHALQRDSGLQLRHCRAHAVVDALAERPLPADRAVDVEGVGVVELALVVVGRPVQQQDLIAFGDRRVVQLDVACRGACASPCTGDTYRSSSSSALGQSDGSSASGAARRGDGRARSRRWRSC